MYGYLISQVVVVLEKRTPSAALDVWSCASLTGLAICVENRPMVKGLL